LRSIIATGKMLQPGRYLPNNELVGARRGPLEDLVRKLNWPRKVAVVVVRVESGNSAVVVGVGIGREECRVLVCVCRCTKVIWVTFHQCENCVISVLKFYHS